MTGKRKMGAKKPKKLIPQTNSSKASKKSVLKKVAPKHVNKNSVATVRGNPSKLTPFKPGQSGNPNGRPRKLVSTLISEMNAVGVEPLKASQIMDAYETLFNMTIKEITEKALDNDQPIFIRIIAKAMLSNKGSEMLDKMMDRAHGRSKQSLDIKGEIKTDTIDYSKLSDAALKEIMSLRK